jgi:tetratricopeptide (TPR) repeat protein
MPALLLGGAGMLRNALAVYAGAFVFVAFVAKAAIAGIGLPDWVFPGALIVMALGLPGILFTGYAQRVARQAITRTPTITPGGSTTTQGAMATIAVKASPHLSWRRVTIGGVLAVGGFVLLIGAYMVLRAFGIGPAGSLLGAGTFKNRDRLVVADFRVRGADSSLAGVVGEAIRSALSQSSVVSTLAPAQIQASLTRMQRAPNTRVDLAVAREVAQREGAKAVVDGDITPLGAGFVVSLRLVGADSAQELASFRETADSPKDLLAAIDKLTRALRGKIGESLRAINANPPLDQVTTTSLQALQLYTTGSAANSMGDYTEAVKLLRQAVAIDTTFAMAYRKLSVAMENARMNPDSADAMLEAAYRHRDRATDLERLFTLGTYWNSERHFDRAKAINAYETLVQRYPSEYGPWLNLANLYRSRRDFVRADSAYRRSEALYTNNNFALFNPIDMLLGMGDIPAARERLAHARQMLPNNPRIVMAEGRILYAERKYDSSYAKFAEMRQSRSDLSRGLAFGYLSLIDPMLGRLATAHRTLAEFRAAEAARGRPAPLEDALNSAHIDSWYLGQSARALKTLDSALARTPLASLPERSRPYVQVIELFSTLGRTDRARAILGQLDEAHARDTTAKRLNAPQRHEALAWIALGEKRPLDAVSEFRKADSLPDGPRWTCVGCIQAFVARAFDAANLPDSALTAYSAYVDAPPDFGLMFVNNVNLGPALKRLGELYEAKGDREKAVRYYQRFIELWKAADPVLQPHVTEVRRRLIRLRDIER